MIRWTWESLNENEDVKTRAKDLIMTMLMVMRVIVMNEKEGVEK